MGHKNEKDYINLRTYCRWGDIEGIKSVFENVEEQIDIFFEDNILFRFAISEEESDMLQAIIDYYETQVITHLNDHKQELIAKQKLAHAIEEAVDSTSSISDKVQEVVNRYSSHTDGEDYLNDLDEIELVYDEQPLPTDHQKNTVTLTEDNLVMLSGDSNDVPL